MGFLFCFLWNKRSGYMTNMLSKAVLWTLTFKTLLILKVRMKFFRFIPWYAKCPFIFRELRQDLFNIREKWSRYPFPFTNFSLVHGLLIMKKVKLTKYQKNAIHAKWLNNILTRGMWTIVEIRNAKRHYNRNALGGNMWPPTGGSEKGLVKRAWFGLEVNKCCAQTDSLGKEYIHL